MTGLPISTIVSGLGGFVLIFGGVALLVARAQLRKSPVGGEAMVGLTGEVRAWRHGKGQVFVNGETWKARPVSASPLNPGDRVRVAGRDGLTLLVELIDPGDHDRA